MEKLEVLTYTVTVTIDPEKWATEYALSEPAEALADARSYLADLIRDGLARQHEWGIVTNMDISPCGMYRHKGGRP